MAAALFLVRWGPSDYSDSQGAHKGKKGSGVGRQQSDGRDVENVEVVEIDQRFVERKRREFTYPR